jgi:hypothetical protein
MTLGTVLLIILILVLLGTLPTWPTAADGVITPQAVSGWC